MTLHLDEEQLERDDLAARRRERDREREPRRFRHPPRDLRARRQFQARQIDLVNATQVTAIECPACVGPIFVPADSVDERVDCIACDARLLTVQTRDGVAAVLLPGGAP